MISQLSESHQKSLFKYYCPVTDIEQTNTYRLACPNSDLDYKSVTLEGVSSKSLYILYECHYRRQHDFLGGGVLFKSGVQIRLIRYVILQHWNPFST